MAPSMAVAEVKVGGWRDRDGLGGEGAAGGTDKTESAAAGVGGAGRPAASHPLGGGRKVAAVAPAGGGLVVDAAALAAARRVL